MPFGLTPWILIGALGFGLALGIAGYLKGHADAKADCDIRVAKIYSDAADKAQKEKDAEAAKANTSAATLETKNEAAKVIFRNITRTVDRVVEKPVYRNVCLDDDGLLLANAALAGLAVEAGAPRQLNAGMPNAGPAH